MVSFDTWGVWVRDHQQDHDVLGDLQARMRWFCDEPVELEGWGLGLRLLESDTFTEGPAEVLAVLPPDMLAMLPVLADLPRSTPTARTCSRRGRASSVDRRIVKRTRSASGMMGG
ncbi:hypothetical protein BH20ACT1_BH20ACT1_00340 [soil metagenome]